MRRRVSALAALLAVITVACSVVDDGRVQRINPGALDDTLPTTTEANTTTTEAATTTTTGLKTTTTGVQAVAVQLYYIAGSQLNSVPNQLPPQFALQQLIKLLQVGLPQGDLGRTLRSALPTDVEITVTADGAGVAQVMLPDGFFDTIAVGDQRLVVGQLVMTLLDNSRGIGQLMFNQQVSGPSGEVIPAGQLITRLDYQSLLASATTTFTTSATTTFTTLTVATSTTLVG